MTLQIWFWLFMALWIAFGVWRDSPNPNWRAWGGVLLIEFILFLILGWQVFGSPVK